MATHSRTTFQKRQKELARLEKRRDKAARKAQRKLAPPESDIMELDPEHPVLPVEVDPEHPVLPTEADPEHPALPTEGSAAPEKGESVDAGAPNNPGIDQ